MSRKLTPFSHTKPMGYSMRLYWHDIKNYHVDLIFSIEVFEVTEAEYAIVERTRCISFEGEGVLEQALHCATVNFTQR